MRLKGFQESGPLVLYGLSRLSELRNFHLGRYAVSESRRISEHLHFNKKAIYSPRFCI